RSANTAAMMILWRMIPLVHCGRATATRGQPFAAPRPDALYSASPGLPSRARGRCLIARRRRSIASVPWMALGAAGPGAAAGRLLSQKSLVKGGWVGGEGRASFRMEIEHVPAGIELELGAAGRADRRQVVEDVAADRIGGHQVAAAMCDEQA